MKLDRIAQLGEEHFKRIRKKFFRSAQPDELRDVGIYPCVFFPHLYSPEIPYDRKLADCNSELLFIWEQTDMGYFDIPITADYIAFELRTSASSVRRHLKNAIEKGIVYTEGKIIDGKKEVIYHIDYPKVMKVSQESLNLITEFCWKYGNPVDFAWSDDLKKGVNKFPPEEFEKLMNELKDKEEIFRNEEKFI